MTAAFPETIGPLLAALATEHGERDLLRGPRGRLTYRGLEARSAALARGLLAQGAKKGSRIGLLLPNSPDFVVTLMAAARIGALVVPLSTLYQVPELAAVLRHADIEHLISADRFLRHDYLARLEEAFLDLREQRAGALHLRAAPFLRRIHVVGHCNRAWAEPVGSLNAAGAAIAPGFGAAVEAQVSPSDLLVMIYTSGSSGEPKGVVHTQGALLRHTRRMSRDYTIFAPGDRIAIARPFFWIAGLTAGLFYAMQAGACLVLQETDDVEAAAALVESESVDYVIGLGPTFPSLKARLELGASRFTIVQVANNMAAVALCAPLRFASARLEARAPAARFDVAADRFANFYGMSETLAAHTAEPQLTLLPEGKAGASGRALPGIEHRLIDPRTGAPANPGELRVRGPTLMAGLYKREREDVFEPDGSYRSGDICAIDADGYLRVLGRADDMLKVSGANVSPLEVERALALMPGIADCAVLPKIKESGAKELIAVVQPVSGARIDEAAVLSFLRTRISSYKVPKRVVVVAAADMPRTGSGKIRKADLAQRLATWLPDERAAP